MADKTRRNIKRRNIKRRLQKIDSTAEGINASQLVLTKQQQKASEVLDAAVNVTANQIRVGSKALAKVAQDPEAMKSLSETIEAVGNATAKVAENSGEITADMVEKFGLRATVVARLVVREVPTTSATRGMWVAAAIRCDSTNSQLATEDSAKTNGSYLAVWFIIRPLSCCCGNNCSCPFPKPVGAAWGGFFCIVSTIAALHNQ